MLKHKYGDLNDISDQQPAIHQELELTVNHSDLILNPDYSQSRTETFKATPKILLYFSPNH